VFGPQVRAQAQGDGSNVNRNPTEPGVATFSALDPAARFLVAGDLSAVFLPGRGMLGASLRHRGEELLGRVEDLEASIRMSTICGIPLLHPWANRLDGLRYAAAGREVELEATSPLLHFDRNGLPSHGVSWTQLPWQVIEDRPDALTARLDWRRNDLLAVFPFPHRLELTVTIRPASLTIATTLIADGGSSVPVSFGFHPYFRLPGLSRAEWQVEMPEMRRLVLDARNIPTGHEEPFAAFNARLGTLDFDDGFIVFEGQPAFSLAGAGRQITVQFLEGYPYAQIYAPRGKDFIAFEPMTAPTNALVAGHGLRLAEPGRTFRATFRVDVEAHS
jgi:aldose 1-epimerase